jgi:type II secretory pathway pseudopilin PulG
MTLVEMMMALLISSILVTLIFQFFASQAASFEETRQTSEMQQELRWAINFVGEHLKLAGNGIPPTSGWALISNADGGSNPDSLSVLGSFKSLVINTTQTMGNEGSQVKVDNTVGVESGDLAVISDGTFTEIFMITDINSLHLWHDTYPPWNDDNKLDHRYALDSTLSIVTNYTFYVGPDEDGNDALLVETQAYYPQVLLGNVDDFQIRFIMKNGDYQDEISADEIYDIRMIEITIRARTPEPIRDYVDPVYGDAYKRVEMQSVIIPKNITII